MTSDLLSTICREIEERLSELHPLLAEHEQLLVAADTLTTTGSDGGSAAAVARSASVKGSRRRAKARPGRRGSDAGAVEGAASAPTAISVDEPIAEEPVKLRHRAAMRRSAKTPRSAPKPKPERAARGAAREAILAALDHGSHTVGELTVVTAMSGPNINGNLRRLFTEGAVIKTEREGKAAWVLANAVI